MQGLGPVTNADLLATGQQPLMKLWINVGGPIDITTLPDPVTGVPKNYLKDISFSSGGARMSPNPIAGQFSAIISNEGNIFHPNHPTSGYQTYFQAGRQVWIELGGNYAVGGIKYWQRIIGYMDEPEFSSDTFELTIKGLDYMKVLSDTKFTKEIQGVYPGTGYTPIDNYWGAVKTISTTATVVTPGLELYNEADALDIVGDANNVANWAAGVGCARAAAIDGVGAPPSVNQMWIQKNVPGVTSGYTENDSPPLAVTLGTQYRVSFYWRQVDEAGNAGRLKLRIYASGAGGALIAESPNCTDPGLPYTQITFYFTSTITGNIKLRFYVEGAGHSATEFYIDDLSIRGMTIGANTPYQLPGTSTGIYSVELDNQDGDGFQPVWPGKQKGEGWYYDIPTRWFSFDKDKFINAGGNNLHIWYFEAQAPENVVADIMVKAGLYANRAAALAAMAVIATGVSVDRVWFNAGSTYISAIKKLCERCNYRFYFNWNGDPKFVTAPTVGVQQFTTFLPQHFTSPKLYQDTNEIRNRIVIEGEKRAELTGWEENMPSELKDEVSDAPSIVAYGEHTLNIRNHLFQDQISISAMCGTLLVAYRIPKWYFDFETPYNAVPLELGDTVWVQELLDIALPITVTHICLIRNADIALYNVTYKCEMEGGGMIELLASIDDIDLNDADETVLFTVPAGRGCIITKVIMRNATGAGLPVGASISFGFNAGTSNDVIADAVYVLTAATKYIIIPAKDDAERGVAEGLFALNVNIAEGAVMTVTIDVFGYLYWP